LPILQHKIKEKSQTELCDLLEIVFLIVKTGKSFAEKRVLTEWGGGGYAKNLLASPFNEKLSNDTTFSQIPLDGQRLYDANWDGTLCALCLPNIEILKSNMMLIINNAKFGCIVNPL
jgi:hypothetical protein